MKTNKLTVTRALRLLMARYAVIGITGRKGHNLLYDLKMNKIITNPPKQIRQAFQVAPFKWFMHMMTVDTEGGYVYEVHETSPIQHIHTIDYFNQTHNAQVNSTEKAHRAVWVSNSDKVLTQAQLTRILLNLDAWGPLDT